MADVIGMLIACALAGGVVGNIAYRRGRRDALASVERALTAASHDVDSAVLRSVISGVREMQEIAR